MSSTNVPLNIVRLDGIHLPRPDFAIPHTYTEYSTTLNSEVASRITDADVIITTNVPLSTENLDPTVTPKLKLVAVMATGTDLVDLKVCKERGVIVCNVPAGSNESVAQHAIALFLALRRRIPRMNDLTKDGTVWSERGTCTGEFGGVPGGWSEEVVGIIGAGDLGNQIAGFAKAMGMAVMISERKGETEIRQGRVSFTETLQKSTVIMITCPLTNETRGMIDTAEFALMGRETLVVNVARGPIIVDDALISALKSGQIAGGATDVFGVEPATKQTSALVREGSNIPNLIMSPHVAWYCQSSMTKVKRVLQANVEAFWAGKPQNVVLYRETMP